jgi:ERCC4-type nuclease
MRKGFTVYRTWDHYETAYLLKALIDKMANWAGGPPTSSGLVLSKRKRDGDERSCQIRMLCCIPSVSEAVAIALLEHFGDISSLQQVLSGNAKFPKVSLGKTSIGKARVETLRKYLCVAQGNKFCA